MIPHDILQWNLSIADTFGTADNVLISELSSFQGWFYTLLYVAGTMHSVLIKEVSSFQGCPYRGVPRYEELLRILVKVYSYR